MPRRNLFFAKSTIDLGGGELVMCLLHFGSQACSSGFGIVVYEIA
jgi:hypothetical protein